jgi:hypothetical protein
VRPRLRDGVFLARAGDDTIALGLRDPVVLPGADLAAWVERLAPHLDGSRSLAELTAGQPPARAAALERVVTALTAGGLVTDATTEATVDGAADATDATHAAGAGRDGGRSGPGRFAAEVMVAGDGGGRGAAGFLRWRAARTLVVADPAALTALVAAVELAGGRPVTAAAADLPAAVAGADVVVHLAGPADLDRAALLDRLCAAGPAVLAQAVVIGPQAWLGPFGPDARTVGWTSAWRRLRPDPATHHAPGPGPGPGPGPVAGGVNGVNGPGGAPGPGGGWGDSVAGVLLRNRLVNEVLRQVAGAHDGGAGAWMVRLDLDSLAATRHPVLAHPLVRPAGPVSAEDLLATVARLRGAARARPAGTGADELDRAARPAVDPWLGPLRSVDDGGLPQLPLRVAVASVAAGVSAGPDLTVVASGPDTATARSRAIRRGLAAYAARVLDPRRLRLADLSAAPGSPPQPVTERAIGQAQERAEGRFTERAGEVEEAVARLRSGSCRGTVAGVRLAGGRLSTSDPRAVVAVDVLDVFPELLCGTDGRTGAPGPVHGDTWEQAVGAGLSAHCVAVTVAGLADRTQPCPVVDVDRVRLDPVAARYRAAMADLRLTVVVRDVTGPLGVPVYGFEVAGQVVAYSAAATVVEALRDGWEQVLLAGQRRTGDGAAPAPRPLPQPRRRSSSVVAPRPAVPAGRLVTALRAAGHVPVVVPLDHDPEVTRLLPVVVRVLLHHGARRA